MATLDDAEGFLVGVENTVKELGEKYNSKQSERVLSSHVWMSDYIDGMVKNKVNRLRDALTTLKDKHVGEFRSVTQFDAIITFCNDISKLLNDINTLYRMRSNYVDIKLKFQYNLPQIEDKIKHMRNRFNIIKGQLTKKTFEYEEDTDWF
ncbi:hypothetical protein J4230_01260 [Candidatus Woesearchaeota archaeon]|nr:hypothetical protein [Candidatus Woesearchaeota archaeon]